MAEMLRLSDIREELDLGMPEMCAGCDVYPGMLNALTQDVYFDGLPLSLAVGEMQEWKDGVGKSCLSGAIAVIGIARSTKCGRN